MFWDNVVGHAFGYYNYGSEHGLTDALPSRDAAAHGIQKRYSLYHRRKR